MVSFSGIGIGLSFMFGSVFMVLVVAELYYLLWWKKKQTSIMFWKKPIKDEVQEVQDLEKGVEESVETELFRIHNLCGPPRFLFTIKEESKEDLESDNGRSRKGSRNKSLSDLFLAIEESSSPLALETYNHGMINPLFEDRLRLSPPPKMKFLKDAEEKFLRRMIEEGKNGTVKNKNLGQNQASAQVLPLESSPTG